MASTAQLEHWEGDFGTQYTDRNVADLDAVETMLRRIVGSIKVQNVLEVSCNRGHNLIALRNATGADAVGIEPNPHAIEVACKSGATIAVLRGNGLDLPFKDNWFDLVFTAGVLIHVSPSDLPKVMDEIHRVSRRFVLAIEYFAPEPTVVKYRGHENLLWKRDFGGDYINRFADLRMLASGYEEQWDRSNWWLMEKTSGAQ